MLLTWLVYFFAKSVKNTAFCLRLAMYSLRFLVLFFNSLSCLYLVVLVCFRAALADVELEAVNIIKAVVVV